MEYLPEIIVQNGNREIYQLNSSELICTDLAYDKQIKTVTPKHIIIYYSYNVQLSPAQCDTTTLGFANVFIVKWMWTFHDATLLSKNMGIWV